MIPILLVVNNPSGWPLQVEGVEVVGARQYLTQSKYSELRGARVFNLCKSYSYQSLGYYVSLLAEARGHKPIPDVITIQDMKSTSLVRVITDDLDRQVQRALRPIHGDSFTLSVYFGKTMAKRDRALGLRLYSLFRSPLMRAQFMRKKGKWLLQSVGPITTGEIPENHMPDVLAAAKEYFAKRQWAGSSTRSPRYSLAILIDPEETTPPSDQQALDRFVRAAQRQSVGTTFITKDDYERVAEFDALFIRATTQVNHYTYRFARRAVADGVAVIDDPVSIARCTNKVYLAERLGLNHVSVPPTTIVHKDNLDEVLQEMTLPCVLKQPDSAFSRGVTKVESAEELNRKLDELLDDSDMVIAQAYMPTEFDWRVGVLDGEPLYVCRYYMARHHWQIIHHQVGGQVTLGRADSVRVEDAPPKVVRMAVKAARLIGDGLYGVDVKEVAGLPYVIEVNDNPSLDGGVEDVILKDQLYDRIIQSLLARVERIRDGGAKGGRKSVPAGTV